jgi:preprotein translocase subunit SecE
MALSMNDKLVVIITAIAIVLAIAILDYLLIKGANRDEDIY